MQIESAETDPSASVGDCNYTAAMQTNKAVPKNSAEHDYGHKKSKRYTN